MRFKALRVTLLCLLAWFTLPASAATVTVHVFNFNFSTNPQGQPIAEATINVGDTIQWVWDSGTHTCTSVKGSAENWDSGILTVGNTFDHTFTGAGVYIYYCKIHGSDNGNGTASGMSGMITVLPPAPSVISVTTPATIVGSLNATGTLTLSGPAPAGGAVVALSSTNPAADVPASVTVPATATSTTFTIMTTVVAKTSSGVISASDNGVVNSNLFKVLPIQVLSVKISPASVIGGADTTGTVKLDAPAPTGGIIVGLHSNDPSVAQPIDGSGNPLSSITIPAGSLAGAFSIGTASVTSTTAVSIAAAADGASKSTSLKVLPVQVLSVKISPASVTGGADTTGTVKLDAPAAPGDIVVNLISNDPSVAQPIDGSGNPLSSITIPTGSLTGTFSIGTAAVASTTAVSIMTAANGASKIAALKVLPVGVLSFTLKPTIVKGGNSITGTVALTGRAGPGSITVTFASNSAAVSAPASITIPVGALTGTVTIGTNTVTINTVVTLSATANGITKSGKVTVTP